MWKKFLKLFEMIFLSDFNSSKLYPLKTPSGQMYKVLGSLLAPLILINLLSLVSISLAFKPYSSSKLGEITFILNFSLIFSK